METAYEHGVEFSLPSSTANWIGLALRESLKLKKKMSRSYSLSTHYIARLRKGDKMIDVCVEYCTRFMFRFSKDRSTVYLSIDLQQHEKEKFINIFNYEINDLSDISKVYSDIFGLDPFYVKRERLSDSMYRSMLLRCIKESIASEIYASCGYRLGNVDGFIQKSIGDLNFRDVDFIESLCFNYKWIFYWRNMMQKDHYFKFENLTCKSITNKLERSIDDDESVLFSNSTHFIVLTNKFNDEKDVL